ncbi:hypothetical protein SODG_006835 [Sodalis praecaptivus]
MSELLEHERAVAECLLASYGAAVPPAAPAVAGEHLTDLLGVMLAGAQHPSTLALLATLPAQVPVPGASARHRPGQKPQHTTCRTVQRRCRACG